MFPLLFCYFAFLWRIGWACELNAVAVRIGEWNYPKTIANEWAFPRLYSTRLELAIERERVFALETDVHSSPQSFVWLALRQELLKHDGGIPKLKPAPTNPTVWLVLLTVRNPPVPHFEATLVNIEPQRGFHVGHAEKGHRLLDVNARSGCDGHSHGFTPQRSLLVPNYKP